MKILLFIFLVAIEVCYAQSIPHTASISVSKDSIKSDEALSITYTLTDVKGYIFIGVKAGNFETIGSDRWEGIIKAGEVKKVKFTVKLKEKARLLNRVVPLAVGFSYNPFGKRISDGDFLQKNIVITDFKVSSPKPKTIENTNDAIINIELNTNPTPEKFEKTMILKRDTTSPILK